MTQRKTNAQFLRDAVAVHGDIFDYSRTDYVAAKTKVTIGCRQHGFFDVIPNNHLTSAKGAGCPACGQETRNAKQSYTQEDFLHKAREVHGDDYDYAKTVYIDSRTKVTITCPEHGDFVKIPASFLSGSRCPPCGYRLREQRQRDKYGAATKEFISRAKEAHGDTYDYARVEYAGRHSPVTIICREHGVFDQRAGDHLNGSGCPVCGHVQRGVSQAFTREQFIEKAREVHGDKYAYDKVDYLNSATKVTITCPDHGDFDQTGSSHIHGQQTCPACARKQSLPERFIGDFIEAHGFTVERRYHVDWMGRKELDIYVPEAKLAIEYNGSFFHTPDGPYGKPSQATLAFNKWLLCHQNGVRLINIHDFQWATKRPQYLSLILHALGLSERVHARKCQVVDVAADVAAAFMNEHHLEGAGVRMGFRGNKGLVHNGRLVAVAAVYDQYIQRTKTTRLSVHRVATVRGLAVIGGVSRLVSQWENVHMSVDLDTGGVMVTDPGKRTPRYWWVNPSTLEFLHRNATQKSKLAERFGLPLRDDDTEVSYMVRLGWTRVFGAGTCQL